MRTAAVTVLLLSLGAAGILWGVEAVARAQARAAWEYHCVLPPGAGQRPPKAEASTPHQQLHHGETGAHPNEKVLNHLGEQGWDLVAIDPHNGHYCFKRPR